MDPNQQTDRTLRDRQGQYTRNPATTDTDAEAARLRSRGLSYRQIAEQLGMSVSSAHDAVRRAMAAVIAEPASDAIAFELDRLDRMYQAALKVLESHHVTVSQGKVVELDGVPLEDDGPVLAAIDRMVKISESRRKLLGLDQPAKTQVSGELRYELIGVNPAEHLT